MVGDDGARLHFFLSYVARERGERVERRKGEKKSLARPFYFLFFRLLSPHTPFIVILSNFWGI